MGRVPKPTVKTDIVDKLVMIQLRIDGLKAEQKALRNDLISLPGGPNYEGKTHKISAYYCRGTNYLSVSDLRRYVSDHVISMCQHRGNSRWDFKMTPLVPAKGAKK